MGLMFVCCLFVSLASGAIQWSNVVTSGDTPSGRYSAVSCFDVEKARFIVSHGEDMASQLLDSTYSLTISNLTWSRIAGAAPSPRRNSVFALDERDARLYSYGGHTATGPDGQLWYFDLSADTWVQVNGGSFTAVSGAVGAINAQQRTLVVALGLGASSFSRALFSWDLDGVSGWTDLSSGVTGIPSARSLAGFARVSTDSFLLFGGWPGPSKDAYQFVGDAAGGSSFALLPEGPSARSLPNAVYHPDSDSVYLFGGSANDPSVHIFHVATKTWSSSLSLTSVPDITEGSNFEWIGGDDFLLFGGRTTGGHESNSLHKMSIVPPAQQPTGVPDNTGTKIPTVAPGSKAPTIAPPPTGSAPLFGFDATFYKGVFPIPGLDGDFIFYWNLNLEKDTISVALKGRGDCSHLGFGITDQKGGTMRGADIVTAVRDSKGIRVDTRYADEFGYPPLKTPQDGKTLLSQSAGIIPSGEFVLKFERLLNPTGSRARVLPTNTSAELIFSFSIGENGIEYHGKNRYAGKFDLNSGIAEGVSVSTLVLAHAVLMCLAWMLFAVIAIFIAAFVPKSNAWWFPAHIVFAVLALVCTAGGFGAIVYFTESTSGLHFAAKGRFSPSRGAHGTIGVIVFILVSIQIVLGIIADRVWQAEHKRTGDFPATKVFPDKVHWYVGRLLLILTIVNCLLGVFEWIDCPDWVFGLFGGIYGVIIFAYIIMSILKSFAAKQGGGGH